MMSLLKLANVYFSEMSTCAQADAQLSAVVMACSGLECLLMMTCLCYKQEVAATKIWKKAAKKAKHKSFVGVLQDRNVGLSLLIDIGASLGWFSNEIPRAFASAVEPDELDSMLSLVPAGETAALVAPRLAKDMRNLLHPGACLRSGRDFESDVTLFSGVAFIGLALASFVTTHGSPVEGPLDNIGGIPVLDSLMTSLGKGIDQPSTV